ncbi:MAG: DUF2330 domain-containing protein [Deltaproteobacteria bacterium]|nr:DUF2330 domain-containing protein [Deltaproteobacteria bacterium]
MRSRSIPRAARTCALVLSAGALWNAPRALLACGGCFRHSVGATPESAQVVTDHRMVLSVSATETTLWDQLRYSGRPEEFLWILPVTDAWSLRVAVGSDAFVDAADLASAPVLSPSLARPSCRGDSTRVTLVRSTTGREVVSGAPEAGSGELTGPAREVTVGPYQTILLDGAVASQALGPWLASEGIAVPEATRAVVQRYTDLRTDSIVLRLRPGQGVQQMRPVRVTMRGYQPTLPLRMISAGAADRVGLTLLVFADGPMQVAGVENARIPDEGLVFDLDQRRSNYRERFTDAVRSSERPVWVTESAAPLADLSLRLPPGDSPVWREAIADLSLARATLSNGLWLTRLRADLTAAQLDSDLTVEPGAMEVLMPSRSIPSVATCNGSGTVRAERPVDASVSERPLEDPGPTGCSASPASGRRAAGAWWALLALAAQASRGFMQRRRTPYRYNGDRCSGSSPSGRNERT